MVDLSLPPVKKGQLAEKHVYDKCIELGYNPIRYMQSARHDILVNGYNIEVKGAFGHHERYNITHKRNDFYALVRWKTIPTTFIVPYEILKDSGGYIKITAVKDYLRYYEAWWRLAPKKR